MNRKCVLAILIPLIALTLALGISTSVIAKKPGDPGNHITEYTITFEGQIEGTVIATGSENGKGIFCRANAAAGYEPPPTLKLSDMGGYDYDGLGFDFQLEESSKTGEVKVMFKWEVGSTYNTLLVDDGVAEIYEGSIRGKNTSPVWGPESISFTCIIVKNE